MKSICIFISDFFRCHKLTDSIDHEKLVEVISISFHKRKKVIIDFSRIKEISGIFIDNLIECLYYKFSKKKIYNNLYFSSLDFHEFKLNGKYSIKLVKLSELTGGYMISDLVVF